MDHRGFVVGTLALSGLRCPGLLKNKVSTCASLIVTGFVKAVLESLSYTCT